MDFTLRLAQLADIPTLEELIPVSVRGLHAPYYSRAQMEAALGPVFGVDRQLITDGTYFVAEHEGLVVGCGGWSKRKSLFGGDHYHQTLQTELDPRKEPARIRAFFVRPERARRGIGRRLLAACEAAILEAGFKQVELVATLAGEPLYAGFNYLVVERFDIDLKNGLKLPAVRMKKNLAALRQDFLERLEIGFWLALTLTPPPSITMQMKNRRWTLLNTDIKGKDSLSAPALVSPFSEGIQATQNYNFLLLNLRLSVFIGG